MLLKEETTPTSEKVIDTSAVAPYVNVGRYPHIEWHECEMMEHRLFGAIKMLFCTRSLYAQQNFGSANFWSINIGS